MTTRPEDLADDVARVIERWRAGRDAESWPSSSSGGRRTTWSPTARPTFSTPSSRAGRRSDPRPPPRPARGRLPRLRLSLRRPGTCPYCGGDCRAVNAVQEILRMAMRHRVPVHLLPARRRRPRPARPGRRRRRPPPRRGQLGPR